MAVSINVIYFCHFVRELAHIHQQRSGVIINKTLYLCVFKKSVSFIKLICILFHHVCIIIGDTNRVSNGLTRRGYKFVAV